MSEKRTSKPLDQALRELVDAAGLTEEELASRTSVTQGTINKYLRSRRGRQEFATGGNRSADRGRVVGAPRVLP